LARLGGIRRPWYDSSKIGLIVVAHWKIPNKDQVALGVLGRLNDSDFETLSLALETLPARTNITELVAAIDQELTRLGVGAIGLADALMTMALALSRTEDNILALHGISETIATSETGTEINPEILESRLSRVLSIGSVKFSAKAAVIQVEHGQVFQNCRILTDVRPVFRDEIAEGLCGLLIVHQLRIAIQDKNGNRSDFYVALDDRDLESVIQNVQRAKEKSAVLRRTFIEQHFIDTVQ